MEKIRKQREEEERMRKIRETAYDVGLFEASGEMHTSTEILSSEVVGSNQQRNNH